MSFQIPFQAHLSKEILLEVVILDQPPSAELAHLVVKTILLAPEDQQTYIVDQQTDIVDQQADIVDQQAHIVDQQAYADYQHIYIVDRLRELLS